MSFFVYLLQCENSTTKMRLTGVIISCQSVARESCYAPLYLLIVIRRFNYSMQPQVIDRARVAAIPVFLVLFLTGVQASSKGTNLMIIILTVRF
jgi:hypothetical protein